MKPNKCFSMRNVENRETIRPSHFSQDSHIKEYTSINQMYASEVRGRAQFTMNATDTAHAPHDGLVGSLLRGLGFNVPKAPNA